jgi:proteasome accessory factor B
MRHAKPPLKRLQLIHQKLKDGLYPNTATLSEQIEVSRRTILRDIEYMRDQMGAPIEYSPEKRGFYYTEPSYMFPSIQFTEGELIAVFVAEKALAQYKGTTYEKTLNSAFNKIVANLPKEITITPRTVDESLSFRTSASSNQDISIFSALASAAIKKKQIEISYLVQNRNEPTTRVIDPYHLTNFDGEWYLLAYCHLRKDIRIFMTSRIRQVKHTGVAFIADKGFSVMEHLDFAFGIFAGHGEHIVRLKFDEFAARYIREKIWHSSQNIKEHGDGSITLTLNINSLIEIKRWILSWDKHIEVLEPIELREDIIRTLSEMKTIYTNNSEKDVYHG